MGRCSKGAKNVDAIISKLLKNVNKFVFETDDENTITYTVTYPKDNRRQCKGRGYRLCG